MKGRIKYVPSSVLGNIESIKRKFGCKDGEALKKMSDYSVVGMKVEQLDPISNLLKIIKNKK